MTEQAAAGRGMKGNWVEIRTIILKPGERAPQVPEDTRQVALEMRARGFLNEDAAVGEACQITTVTGRHLDGLLASINPAYSHGFGPPLPELNTIGLEVRALLCDQEGEA